MKISLVDLITVLIPFAFPFCRWAIDKALWPRETLKNR
jgi:hypothetical protein